MTMPHLRMARPFRISWGGLLKILRRFRAWVQPLLQLVTAFQKPELRPAIAFADKVSQSRTLLQMFWDIAEYRDAKLVCNELLEHCACNSRLEAEEITVKPLCGNHDEAGAMC